MTSDGSVSSFLDVDQDMDREWHCPPKAGCHTHAIPHHAMPYHGGRRVAEVGGGGPRLSSLPGSAGSLGSLGGFTD